MPNYGDTRTVDAGREPCPFGDTAVQCTQGQVYERAWYFLWLAGHWVDQGARRCRACPSGKQPEDTLVYLCCFAGAYAVLPEQVTGPGLAGFLSDHLIPQVIIDSVQPAPMTWGLTQLNECNEINAVTLRFLIDNLAEGEARLRAEGRNSEAEQNKKAIECLKRNGRELGWYPHP